MVQAALVGPLFHRMPIRKGPKLDVSHWSRHGPGRARFVAWAVEAAAGTDGGGVEALIDHAPVISRGSGSRIAI